MEHFLEVVADGYAKKYKDLSRITFVMPNKRSGFFLLKYFERQSVGPVLAPGIISITDFIDRCIVSVRDSRLDLLCRLFESYNKVNGETGMPFEKFSAWGETMLTDFNEVDMHMVNSEEIFNNVADLNYIRSNFLSEEQKRIMEEYFGCSPDAMLEETQRFWKNFQASDDADEATGEIKDSRKKFYTLWQLLPLIYQDFKAKLREDGFTTEGGAYREASERIEEGWEPFPGDKLVFVGFNALAESERRIFKALKVMSVEVDGCMEPKADFVWDQISSQIADDNDPAVRFVRVNARKENFPSPGWLKECLSLRLPAHKPEVEVVAVPSNTMQVKVASSILDSWKKDKDNKIVDSSIAVILPDERLLLPLLHSLPKEYSDPNLTMGFPLKYTSAISFAALLKRLHMHSHRSGFEDIFLFEDVKDLLAHPYSHVLFPNDKISGFIKNTENAKRIVVSSSMLGLLGEKATVVFRHFEDNVPSNEVIAYIKNVYDRIKESLYTGISYLNSNLEKAYIAAYNDALVRLSNCLCEYDLMLSPVALFTLADRLIAGETVSFQGQPVRGLQVMGMLETRCLDFDRVVILSVNEKVIPRVGRNSTFIPDMVRVAYGMPPAHYQEELFSYYFFRILGRAKHALLTYDSRSSNARTPGASRYLLQMKYLPGGFTFTEKEARFEMPSTFNGQLVVRKDEMISAILDKYEEPAPKDSSDCKTSSFDFKNDNVKNFSASALSNYMDCQLKFLYNHVLEMYVEPEKMETINAIDLGLIIHSSIETLYLPIEKERGRLLSEPKVMTRAFLQSLLKQTMYGGVSLVEEVVRREILKKHFHLKEEEFKNAQLRGSAVFLLDYIVDYVKNIIRADIAQAPFRLWGTEIKEILRYPLKDGKEVNIKMVIDRLDQEGESGMSHPFRVVDYKTGTVRMEAETFQDIFNGNLKSHNIFQLFLYCELLVFMIQNRAKEDLPAGIDREDFISNLKMAIYSILQLPDEGNGIVYPILGKEKISSLSALRAYEQANNVSFRDSLDNLLTEILNREAPFSGEISDRGCAYCDYRIRCETLAATKTMK